MSIICWEQTVLEYGFAGVASIFGIWGLWAAAQEPSLWVINSLALVAGVAAIAMRFWDRLYSRSTRDELVESLKNECKIKDARIQKLERQIEKLTLEKK